jgi:hypothetical protein
MIKQQIELWVNQVATRVKATHGAAAISTSRFAYSVLPVAQPFARNPTPH